MNTVRRLALATLSTLMSLVVAECAFRVHRRLTATGIHSDDAWRQRLRRMNATIYRRSDDPRLIYEPNPGSHVAMPYGEAGFNSAGMRDDREHSEQPDARLRVAIIGDSIAWSEEVALQDSLARQIERAMNPQRTEVLNFGVTGYDTGQEAAWYRRAVQRFRPHIVVLVYCLNDAMIMSGPFNRFATAGETQRKTEQDALFERIAPLRAETLDDVLRRGEAGASFALFSRALSLYRSAAYARSNDYIDEYLIAHAQSDNATRLEGSLRDIATAANADGGRAHLVISPILRDWRHYHWIPIHSAVARAAGRAGWTVHDPLVEWRGHESPEALRLPGDILHYSVVGNHVLAEYIAARLAR